jgi:hypothetical protein
MPSDPSQKKPVQADGFRYIPSDTIGFSISDHHCKITFGMEEADKIVEQFSAVLTPTTAKLLWLFLDQGLKYHEARAGREIPLDEAKAEIIRQMLAYRQPGDEET